MFKFLLKGILSGIAGKLLENYRRLSVQLLKIEAAKACLHGLRIVRLSAISLMQMVAMVALIGAGAMLVHVALFILLPWTLETKAVVGLCLGVVYMIVGGVALSAAMDERVWMKKSGAAELLEDALGKSKDEAG